VASLIQDLMGIPVAFSLFPLLLLIPGYVLGWYTNVLSFRSRSGTLRILLGVVLSIAVCPILTYLAARLVSLPSVWLAYAFTWLVFLGLAAYRVRKTGIPMLITCAVNSRRRLIVVLAVAVWVALATSALSDLQIADGLFVSWVYGDYAKHIAVTNAISQSGVPPTNPFFFPGYTVELFLYYFWWLLCSLIYKIGQPLTEPRQAVFGGTVWAGIALMAIVVLYLDFLAADHPNHRKIRILVGLALLLISGLDILPIVGEAAAYSVIDPGGITRSSHLFLGTTGWNHDALVESWLNAVFWVPQHVASLIAGLTGLLVFRSVRQVPRLRDRTITIVIAACAFASAVGLSVWVALVFGVALMLLVLFSLFLKRYSDVRSLSLICLVAALLCVPYLLDLRRANQLDGTPVTFAVRTFGPADRLVSSPGTASWLWLVDLAFLPINYSIEFGLVGVLAILYWRERLRSGTNLGRDDLLLLAMFSASMFVCTFFRSSVQNNDLGWRGVMLAQFVLIIWSVGFVIIFLARLPGEEGRLKGRFSLLQLWRSLGEHCTSLGLDRRVLRVFGGFLIIGSMATTYDLIAVRSYAVLKSNFDDRRFAERFGAMRQTYQWVNNNLPEKAIVQHDPAVEKDFFHELYGWHRVIVSDRYFGTLLGIRKDLFDPIAASVTDLFSSTDDNNLVKVEDLCKRYSIDALIVKDTDPVWLDSQSWVWKREPLFGNAFARVFACDGLAR
jgi:hypothetical protein